MTKTKFTIEYHKSGSFNDNFSRIIANHNEGRIDVKLDIFEKYAFSHAAIWPTITPDFEFEYRNEYSFIFMENKKATLSISVKEIHELDPVQTEEGENLEQK